MSQSDWRFIFLTNVIFPGTLKARHPHRKDIDQIDHMEGYGWISWQDCSGWIVTSLKTVVLYGGLGIGP